MMMKRVFVSFWLLVCGCGTILFAQQEAVKVDTAINNSMQYLSGRLPAGSKVVVLNFNAPARELSDYIIEHLTAYIVNDGRMTVVDRRNLELLQQEMNFQMSGEVDEETAQEIGKKLGAQTIISGSISPLVDDVYRMWVQAIQVETAQIQGARNETVELDRTLAGLLKVEYTETASQAPQSAGGTASAPRPPAARPGGSGEFSVGRRFGAGALNLVLGLGSFTMGDWKNSLALAGGYALSVGLIVYEVTALSDDDKLANIPGAIGLGVAGVTAVYGFIAPFIYKPRGNAFSDLTDRVNIAVIPDRTGIKAVCLSYSWQF
jgi:hypothetical protein